MATVNVAEERTQRVREVENALANLRLEGLEPSAEALHIGERYRDGVISFERMQQEFAAFLGLADGPVPISEQLGTEESPRTS
ncbi:hypothetical protein F183_A31820 [Bryobacterales bacterium F-183]|nr:hypothetical protein F183_A31820 [Bryobacterales bacterium F-183]